MGWHWFCYLRNKSDSGGAWLHQDRGRKTAGAEGDSQWPFPTLVLAEPGTVLRTAGTPITCWINGQGDWGEGDEKSMA